MPRVLRSPDLFLPPPAEAQTQGSSRDLKERRLWLAICLPNLPLE
ncbi:MAG: hypothetical protein RIS70_2742, partial [Planctomycetota bacterium]